jgi:hypothetical protein
MLWNGNECGKNYGNENLEATIPSTDYDKSKTTEECGIYFFLNNPTRRTNYPNLFSYKTLHVSGILSAHHQEFSTVHSALFSFMQVFDGRFKVESGWNELWVI